MLKADFTIFFRAESKKIIASYKRLIAIRRGVSNDNAPHNAPSTRMRKGKDHWLVDTGETKKNGFNSIVRPKRLLIFASGERHSARRSKHPRHGTISKPGPTYRQLFRWHGHGSNKKRYSGVFGKLPSGSQFPQRFVNEAARQIRPQIARQLTKRIKVTF